MSTLIPILFSLTLPASASPATPAPATAPAKEPAKTPDKKAIPTFAELDTNQDYAITLSESKKHDPLHTDFSSADTDKSGWLSKTEFDAWVKKAKEG